MQTIKDSTTKKLYSRPVLTADGDVRDLTLGVSGGIGESGGNPYTRKNGPHPPPPSP